MTPVQSALLRELVAATGGEALFRPSAADRLIGCPGSIVLAARVPRVPERPSQYALEGTAAHKVAQDALNGIRQPDEWSDRLVRIDDKEGWFVDAEMVESVNLYLDTGAARENAATERFVEHRLSLAPLDPTDPLLAENRGTADWLIVDRLRRRLTVVDLKYGKGVMVPGDSPQLKDYALMALVSVGVGGGWETVETVVVQPRAFAEAERVKSATFTPAGLMDAFLPALVGAMEESLDPKARLTPGKWCRWCPGAGPDERGQPVCPALADRAFNLARDAFMAAPLFDASSAGPLVPAAVVTGTVAEPRPAAPAGGVSLPSPLSLDPADIATILDRRELYRTFMEGVEKRAVALLIAGVAVPGYAMKPRSGDRRFREPDKVPDALRAMGLQTAALYTEPKLKSPAQIEKLLPAAKRKPFDPRSEDSLVERPEGEPTLVKVGEKADTPALAGLGPISAKAEVRTT